MNKLRPISSPRSSEPKPPANPSTEQPLDARLHVGQLVSTWPMGSHQQPSMGKFRTSYPRQHKLLSVDVENKPGTYGGADYTFPKITAIAWKWINYRSGRLRNDAEARVLDRTDIDQMIEVAEEFREVWTEADVIVGHNFRRHDMKLIDGWFATYRLPRLPRRKIIDTYADQPRMEGLSRSLENLSGRWQCPIQKMHLGEWEWEQAYDGVPYYVDMMRRRAASDVMITEWLYQSLVASGLLKADKSVSVKQAAGG